MVIKNVIKLGLNLAGYDVVQSSNSPRQTLLGLKYYPINTVIDVGANTGQFAKKISGFFQEAKIYCFEPLPTAFEELSKWAISQDGKVVPMNVALGSEVGELEMFLHEDHDTSSSVLPTTSLNHEFYPFTKRQKRITVKQSTLDQALRDIDADIRSEILIKLDVQGYERHVISGAKHTLSIARACIVEVCLDGLYEGQPKFDELFALLKNQGYRYAGNLDQAYADDGHCIFLDAVFIR